MSSKPVQKCRCPSTTHGHKPGQCNNLASEPGLMCKPCHDKAATELLKKANKNSDEAALGERLDTLTRAIRDKDSAGVIATLRGRHRDPV